MLKDVIFLIIYHVYNNSICIQIYWHLEILLANDFSTSWTQSPELFRLYGDQLAVTVKAMHGCADGKAREHAAAECSYTTLIFQLCVTLYTWNIFYIVCFFAQAVIAFAIIVYFL